MSKISFENEDSLGVVWIYIIAPWVGAICSGLLYAFLHRPMCTPITCPE